MPVIAPRDRAESLINEALAWEMALSELDSTIEPPDTWESWLKMFFMPYVTHPYVQRHVDLWEWAWAMERGIRPRPFIGIWPRGGSKSTSAELAVVAIAARGRRRYGVYVCSTQSQADDHVANIAAMLESTMFGRCYPRVSQRKLGKFGNSQGWRRNRIRTASGFTLDAIGLDTAARGAKIDEDRPDLMILDDLDDMDTPAMTLKKIRTLTHGILPAGSTDMATLAVQNLIQPDSIFSRFVDGRADFLADRIVSGPFPSIENFVWASVDGRIEITGGNPTWEGQSIERCQQMIHDFGLASFLQECQQNVEEQLGGMYDHIEFKHCTHDEVPDLEVVEVWLDPAVTSTDDSDSHGIQCDGKAGQVLYRLASWEERTTPEDAFRRAILMAIRFHASAIGVEVNQGGDVWKTVYQTVWNKMDQAGAIPEGMRMPKYKSEVATVSDGSKASRGQQMVTIYENGDVIHVVDGTGSYTMLERSLRRFPKFKPHDLADSAYWSWRSLLGKPKRTMAVY